MSFQIFANIDNDYEDIDYFYDDDYYSSDTEMLYNTPDQIEQDPEVIRSELLFYNTPRTQQWSPYVYGSLMNIQNQCYGDYATLCDRNAAVFEIQNNPSILNVIFDSFDKLSYGSIPDCFEEASRRLAVSSTALHASHGMEMLNGMRGIYHTPKRVIKDRLKEPELAMIEKKEKSEKKTEKAEKRRRTKHRKLEREFTPIIPRHTIDPRATKPPQKMQAREDPPDIFLPPPGQPQEKLQAEDHPPYIFLPPVNPGKSLRRMEQSGADDLTLQVKFSLDDDEDPTVSISSVSSDSSTPFDRIAMSMFSNLDQMMSGDLPNTMSQPDITYDRDFDRELDRDFSRGGDRGSGGRTPREGPPRGPPPPPRGDVSRPPPPPPPREPDMYFAGAIGFGADGDQCMYYNANLLTPNCQGAIQNFYDMRDKYWREEEVINDGPYKGGLHLLLLGGLFIILMIRRMRTTKRQKDVKSFLSAVHSDASLKASVETSTGMKVPEEQEVQPCCCTGTSTCGRVIKALVLATVVVAFSIIISISSLEITAAIVGSMDADHAVDYNAPPTSPLSALAILLTVCSVEVGMFFLLVRGCRVLVHRFYHQHSPSHSGDGGSDSGRKTPVSRLGAFTSGRVQQWRTYALQTFRRPTPASSSIYAPLISEDMDNSSTHTAAGTIPMQQLDLVSVPAGQPTVTQVSANAASAPQYVAVVQGAPQYAQPIVTANYSYV